MSLLAIDKELNALKNKTYAEHAQRFFKTAKGEYGEGDCFLGIRVPALRKLAKQYKNIDLSAVQKLLDSKWHEKRLMALFILIHQYKNSPDQVYKMYINNFKNINNWDLVDTSCHKIIGPYLFEKDRSILYKWSKSKDLWTKRISMMSTYYFIQRKQFEDALNLAEILLNDKHDLIHKVVGWMLREIGNKSKATEDTFLKKHYKVMPRTMLRYAIEKYPQTERKKILNSLW
ncbi:MAG TPA: DNA alkylation repair protein [Oligoflexia bacterium]|nr:DNA alkylation repair protein [Oligoflexia bacterium]HMR24259.1 DNA alkylation repair protein [Oligoflexia bacterium]